MPPTIQTTGPEDFEKVKAYIQQFELDNRQLKAEEFLTLRKHNELLGFGRIREFDTFSELCSLGILQNQRSKGYGKLLSKALMAKAQKQVYLVCIIPDFFKSFGFELCDNYPKEMTDKLNYCTTGLPVPEKYVVMQLSKALVW